MAQPSSTPTWATGTSAQLLQPTDAKAQTGWVPSEKPWAQHFNWLFNVICQWISYLKNITSESLTWNAPQHLNGGGTCPSPVNDNDIANRAFVLAHSGGGGAGGISTYNTNDPSWAYSPQNPLVFWTEDKGQAFRADGSVFEVKMVRFLGETIPSMNDPGQFIGIMPVGSRPAKTVIVNAMQYPHSIPVTVNPDGTMYLNSQAPVSGVPLVFDGAGYIAYQ